MIDAEPEVEQMTGDSQRILSHRYLGEGRCSGRGDPDKRTK